MAKSKVGMEIFYFLSKNKHLIYLLFGTLNKSQQKNQRTLTGTN